jgi:hypothetical protein
VDHVPAAVLETLDQQRARLVPVGETDGQQFAQRRVLFQGDDELIAELIRLDPVPDFLRQVARDDSAALQGPRPLQYDGDRRNRAKNDRPHEAAAGADDLPHCVLIS